MLMVTIKAGSHLILLTKSETTRRASFSNICESGKDSMQPVTMGSKNER